MGQNSAIKRKDGIDYKSGRRRETTPALFNSFSREATVMPSLKECQSVHCTDKGDKYHTFKNISFLDLYEQYFSPVKNLPLNLLEIGVSLHHTEGQEIGSSLWLWKEYFPNAQIFGFDIDPKCKFYEQERVHVEIGNQSKTEDLLRVVTKAANFDIIIDDGSHVNKYSLHAFKTLFPFLREGGMYVIEDLGCSYGRIEEYGARDWPGMKYNDPNDDLNNDRVIMDDFFKHLIFQLDTCSAEIKSIHFWSQICFILK